MLASGRLEAELIHFLIKSILIRIFNKVPLGNLKGTANKDNLLTSNEKFSFDLILNQLNYITHSIYSLFENLIDKTIMEKENLLDSDIHLYIEMVKQ